MRARSKTPSAAHLARVRDAVALVGGGDELRAEGGRHELPSERPAPGLVSTKVSECCLAGPIWSGRDVQTTMLGKVEVFDSNVTNPRTPKKVAHTRRLVSELLS